MDLEDDATAGFDLISTWDLDEHGIDWIARKVRQRVGSGPVVISLDVDVMDPSIVPASESYLFCPFPRSSRMLSWGLVVCGMYSVERGANAM